LTNAWPGTIIAPRNRPRAYRAALPRLSKNNNPEGIVVSSDFKDVLRERVEDLVRNRLSDVEAAIRAAQTEVSDSIGRLVGSVSASTVNYAEDPVFDQLSNEIKAQVGQAAAESTRLSGDIALLRDAVIDIDAQHTQADVLNVLVERSSNFAPRVILFVIKGQDAIAWAARGFNDEIGDESVRGLSVSLQSDTVLGSVLRGDSAFLGVPGDHGDNAVLLDRLGRVDPERLAAIPLRVRRKVAAVLYADSYDTSVGSISMEALELLVHSAGIIVELASLRQRLGEPAHPPAAAQSRPAAAPPVPPSAEPRVESDDPYATRVSHAVDVEPPPSEPVEERQPVEEEEAPEATEIADEAATAPEPEPEPAFEPGPVAPESIAAPDDSDRASFDVAEPAEPARPAYELSIDTQASAEPVDATFTVPAYAPESADVNVVEPQFSSGSDGDGESAQVSYHLPVGDVVVEDDTEVTADGEEPVSEIEIDPSAFTTDQGEGEAEAVSDEFVEAEQAADLARTERPEPAAPTGVAPAYRRPVPAPGELAEDEEKLHNDARRFARLLVSEIKLYYEQRVAEGRTNNDLYDRLKEEIDRSRQMYEKRVNPAVAERFDYFYDELLSTLAQGDAAKLGSSCPGPTV
jgi:hypothetical protein